MSAQALPTWATAGFEEYVRELSSPSVRTRRQAAAALEILRDGRAVGPLLERLEDEVEEVRVNVVRALGALRDPRAIPALAEALRRDVPEVRVSAAQALWRIGDVAAIPALVAALEDPESRVRYYAARGLIHRYYVPGLGRDEALTSPSGETAEAHRRGTEAMERHLGERRG